MIGTAHATGREGVERGCRPATAAAGATPGGHAARGPPSTSRPMSSFSFWPTASASDRAVAPLRGAPKELCAIALADGKRSVSATRSALIGQQGAARRHTTRIGLTLETRPTAASPYPANPTSYLSVAFARSQPAGGGVEGSANGLLPVRNSSQSGLGTCIWVGPATWRREPSSRGIEALERPCDDCVRSFVG